MKKIIFFALLCLVMGFKPPKTSTECEIKQFYEGVEADGDTMVLTSSGDLEEAAVILVPTKMDEGNLKATLSKKASNLYKIDGTKYYLETRHCYEYTSGAEVMVVIESNYGFSKGKVIF